MPVRSSPTAEALDARRSSPPEAQPDPVVGDDYIYLETLLAAGLDPADLAGATILIGLDGRECVW